MRNVHDRLADIEREAASAYAAAMVEIEQILATDPRIRSRWDAKSGKVITRGDHLDYLQDYAAGCKLPECISFMRFKPNSTLDRPEYYEGIRLSNSLHRMWAHIEEEVEQYQQQLRATGTVVE